LRNNPAGLFNQSQQDMLGVNLVMSIALDDFCRALGGFPVLVRLKTVQIAS